MARPLHFSRRQLPLTATIMEAQHVLVRFPESPIVVECTRKLSKLLLNVNIEGSLGPVQLLMLPESTVGELVKAVLEIYVREKRRPLLRDTNHLLFDLHYSQFTFESLKAEEKLINLGSRNFYLCRKHS